MTNMMTPDEFEIRMNAEIQIAKNKFARTQNRSEFFGALRRTNTENYTRGMRQRDGYTNHIAGDKWLSENDYIQIVAFRSFIVREQFLTDDKIELLVRCCDKEFPVLTDLLNRLPDAIDELRIHGAMSVALIYKNRKYIDAKMEEVTQRESALSK
ncbi:MAG: hypothetical protein IJ371_00615 [Clostridia bacterium]|nr:hypothetical protein [Clostridia bacterium]